MRILVAEDIASARRIVEATLAEAGHEVVAVGDGEEAWAAFQREPAPLLVLDWLMPKLDGLELCRRVRALPGGADVFVLMQTGRGTAEDLAAALDAGVDDYIVKPLTREHLRARVTIAERRIADRAAQRAAEQALARAEWLAGIGATTISMQHELSTPLTILLAEIDRARSAAVDVERRAALDAAEEQTRRVTAVLRRLASLDTPRTVERIPGVRMLDLFSDTDR